MSFGRIARRVIYLLAAIWIVANWGMLTLILISYGAFFVGMVVLVQGWKSGLVSIAGAILFVTSFQMSDEYGLLVAVLMWILGATLFFAPFIHLMVTTPEKRLTT